MDAILFTAIFAVLLAFVLGVVLCIFRKVFHVETDVLISLVRETLPGANCGACGFPGCDGFAAACASGEAAPEKCTVSDAESAKKRAALVGGGSGEIVPMVAVVACHGTKECALDKGVYTGLKTCRGAKISANGTKVCAWGCMGFGDCVNVCKFDALSMGANGIPVVDRKKCRGCKVCVTACPQAIIRLVGAADKGAFAFCNNRTTVKASVRKACKAGCMKCETCVKKCPTQAVVMDNGIPKIDYAKCTSCGECVEKCPQKVLELVS